jgi:hypothetical protein
MKTLLSAALIVATLVSVTLAQGKPDLDRLDEKISSQIQPKVPGWRHKRLPAFGGTSTVLEQTWSSGNRIVKVAVAIRQSVEDAKKEIKSFLQFRREPQELIGFGDEAFAPERDGSDVVFRRGRYVIYISTVADVESDSDARNLSKVELETRRKTEVQRIGKEFAKQLSSIELQ